MRQPAGLLKVDIAEGIMGLVDSGNDAPQAVAESQADAAPARNALGEARDRTRAELRKSFGVDSLFLKVADLAKIMGLAATSIHAQIREERFPLPHRRVGQAALFRVDDFLDWYCGAPAEERIPEVEARPRLETPAQREPGHEKSDHKMASRGGPALDEDFTERLGLVPPAFGASKAEVAKYKQLILQRVAREQAEAGRGESPRERAERVALETRAQLGSARRGRSGNR